MLQTDSTEPEAAPGVPSDEADGWTTLRGELGDAAGDAYDGLVAPEQAATTQPAPALEPALAAETTETVVGFKWPDQPDLLQHCREMDNILAAVLLFCGVAYAGFGYQLFKLLACANLAALGVWGGWWVGRHFDATLPGMVVGGVLMAALAWPVVKAAVASCGAIVGFVIGCAVWRACGLLDVYAPAGGAIGAIFLFMLTFSLFKLSVVVFTAIQGTVMLLAGLLGLLMKATEVDQPVTEWTTQYPVILPVVLFSLSVIGVFFQQGYSTAPAPSE